LKTRGTLASQTHKERQRKINKERLRAYVEENPDKTLMELGEVFQVSHVSIFRSLKKMSITLKKTLGYQERDEEERAKFIEEILSTRHF
jgi:putative heme iron utilization protein